MFNEKGIAGTTIDDILNATKVAKGCLYGHFENKEALSHATVEYMLGKMYSRVTDKLNSQVKTKDKLIAFVDVHQNPLATVFSGGCPILNFAVDSDDTSPEIKQQVKNIITKTLKDLAAVIQRGIQQKELSKEINAEAFALKMFSMIEGGIMVCRATNTTKHMTSIRNMLKEEIAYYVLQ